MYKLIQEELIIISRKIEEGLEQISNLPQGEIYITKNKNRIKWYITNEKKTKYLPKSEKITAEKLVKKKYLKLKIEELEKEKKACSNLLKNYSAISYKSDKILSNPTYYQLLKPFISENKVNIEEWSNSDYIKNTNHPEHLKHSTPSGNVVRSKSEAMIDTALFHNKIPYRYECLLEIGDDFFFPDFTILHPITGKVYYWEHFGMMDNTSYSFKTFSKLQIYCLNNIIPSVNLITTYETKDNPLNMLQIEKIIKEYFI